MNTDRLLASISNTLSVGPNSFGQVRINSHRHTGGSERRSGSGRGLVHEAERATDVLQFNHLINHEYGLLGMSKTSYGRRDLLLQESVCHPQSSSMRWLHNPLKNRYVISVLVEIATQRLGVNTE